MCLSVLRHEEENLGKRLSHLLFHVIDRQGCKRRSLTEKGKGRENPTCANAPSIWPMSIAGLRLSPRSITMSVLRTEWSPVRQSISTTEQPAP